MLTWLDYGMPKCLAKHYLWACLWECFQMRLAFESIDCVKQIFLLNLGEPHWNHWEAYQSENIEKRIPPLPHWWSWDWPFPALILGSLWHHLPGSWAFGLELNLTPLFPWFSGLCHQLFKASTMQVADCGTSRPP